MKPNISVITVCRNAEHTIERTLISVAAQRGVDFEYIIIDGQSTDGTHDLIRKYISRVNVMTIESDRGLYDAMNKGIARSGGDYILFLHADDEFKDTNSLANVAGMLRPDRLNVCGIERVSSNGAVRLVNRKVSRLFLYVKSEICHPGLIVTRRQFERVGVFSTRWEIAGDIDLILRLVKVFKLWIIPVTLSRVYAGGLSSKKIFKSFEEFRAVTQAHGVPCIIGSCIQRLKILNYQSKSKYRSSRTGLL